MKYIPTLTITSNDYNNLINENKKLKDLLIICNKENKELKNKINSLTNDNTKLNDDLQKAKKIISNLKKNPNAQKENNNIINNLNDLIKMKDNLINELRIKLQKNGNNNQPVNFKDIMVINFVSTDQKISCGIQCLKTETFAEVEERLYQQYEEYREKNYNFITKGRLVLRFKKIFENNIQNQDKVQLLDLSSDE